MRDERCPPDDGNHEEKKIRFETQVLETRFDEKTSKWHVKIKDKSGKEEIIVADAVISAVGQLNQPKLPDIPGVGSFKGPAFHSAQWRHDVELAGKRVNVIGTGASAFQFVPAIAPIVKEMKVFQRTPPWLGPTPDYHEKVGEGKKWLLEHVPFYAKWYRFWIFWMMTDGIYEFVKSDPTWNGPENAVSPNNAMLREMLSAAIKPQPEDAPWLFDKIIPDYPFGGKRSVRDNGVWLAALKRQNVELVTEPIAEINANGIKTKGGKQYDADVLIYGTGFHASNFLRTFKVYGRGGMELHNRWNGDARAYLGMTVPGFPNFFMIYGPNTNPFFNGLGVVEMEEMATRFALKCIGALIRQDRKAVDVTTEAYEKFNEELDRQEATKIYSDERVTNYYKNDYGRSAVNCPIDVRLLWNWWLDPADENGTSKTADPLIRPYLGQDLRVD